MKKEVNPVVFWVALALVLIVVVAVGYRYVGSPGFKPDTKGSEETIKRVQEGQPMYQPPADAPVPRPPQQGGGAGQGGGGGMYNLQPPPR